MDKHPFFIAKTAVTTDTDIIICKQSCKLYQVRLNTIDGRYGIC